MRILRRVIKRVRSCVAKGALRRCSVRILRRVAIAHNPGGLGRRLRRGGVGITGVGNNAGRIGAIASLRGTVPAHHGRLILVHATIPFRRL